MQRPIFTARHWHHALMHSCGDASIYAAVRYLSLKEDAQFSTYLTALHLIARLTPRRFTRLFPIDKTYDGQRWQCKDYFFTMEMIEKHGLDTPIGDALPFLWDYCNPHTRRFLTRCLQTLDVHMRQRGQPGALESFFESQGIQIPAYTRVEAPNGKTYMRNQQTGEFLPVVKPSRRPKWWKIIQGGTQQ